jgi:tetratricopeptide (TPR) repeat protein
MLFRAWLCFGLVLGLQFVSLRARADAEGEARKAFEQGVAASSEARWQEARRAFRHSLDLLVKPSTLFNLAVADLKLGNAQEALDALDRFEQLANPKQHAGMLERASGLRAEAERTRDAARPANERVRGLIDPKNLASDARASYEQGRDAYARGDDKLALESFERAHRESGQNELLFDIGIAADRLRADERAVDALSRFIDLFPALPEAEQARRHLDRLTRVIAEHNRPESTATLAAPRDERPSIPAPRAPAASPGLGAPRALLIVGSVLGASAIGTAAWWIERSLNSDVDRCLNDESDCKNYDTVQQQKRAAMGLTLSLSIASLGLLTGGAILLSKRKHGGVVLEDVQVRTTGNALAGSVHFSF